MAGSSSNFFVNQALDVIPTETVISNLLELSLSSLYSVEIKGAKDIWPEGPSVEDISFLAYEAVLPGTSFELGQVFGDRQGITEQYPVKKVYPPIDVSFYIKTDYKIITFFEKWMSLISPLTGSIDNSASYYTFNYPNTYEKLISIVKYEKDARPLNERLEKKGSEGGTKDPKSVTYTLLNAYPTNIISIPVSYDQSSVLKTTVTFNYDRYAFQTNRGKGPKVTVPSDTVDTSNSRTEEDIFAPGGAVERAIGPDQPL
jgi:hypothetical protein